MTTGLFPQELIITLPSAVGIGAISTKTANGEDQVTRVSQNSPADAFYSPKGDY